jgi:hypothetical protein
MVDLRAAIPQSIRHQDQTSRRHNWNTNDSTVLAALMCTVATCEHPDGVVRPIINNERNYENNQTHVR